MAKHKVFLILALALASPFGLHGQKTSDPCATGPQLGLDYKWVPNSSNVDVTYHISEPKGVTAAWVELWLRPKRYQHVRVPVKEQGELFLRDNTPDVDTPPTLLKIGVFDPELWPMCFDSPCKLRPGYVTSEMPAGVVPKGDSNDSGFETDRNPKPEMNGGTIRLTEGADSTPVVLTGLNLRPDTRVLLIERESPAAPSWTARRFLETTFLDWSHIRAAISKEELSEPAVLAAVAVPTSDNDSRSGVPDFSQLSYELGEHQPMPSRQVIIVASQDSPKIVGIEPSAVPWDKESIVNIRGTGFTAKSQVMISYPFIYPPNAQVGPPFGYPARDTEYVSPTELRIRLPKSELIAGRFAPNTPMQIWVMNQDEAHVSEPGFVQEKFPPSVKPDPLPAWITSISPYPISYMDYRSPNLLPLIIRGEHFRVDDAVVARSFDVGPSGADIEAKLRTRFVSENELRAWLPRKLWYLSQVTYRFVIQKQGGFCAVEVKEHGAASSTEGSGNQP